MLASLGRSPVVAGVVDVETTEAGFWTRRTRKSVIRHTAAETYCRLPDSGSYCAEVSRWDPATSEVNKEKSTSDDECRDFIRLIVEHQNRGRHKEHTG